MLQGNKRPLYKVALKVIEVNFEIVSPNFRFNQIALILEKLFII